MPTDAKIRLLGATPVDEPPDQLAFLRDLDVAGDGSKLELTLRALTETLNGAVPSYRGCQMTITLHGYPVTISCGKRLPPDEESLHIEEAGSAAMTSLRMPLDLLGTGFGPDDQVVFYADAPGAFVDLAAGLADVVRSRDSTVGDAARTGWLRTGDAERHPAVPGAPAVLLDVDLPLRDDGPGLRGLAELRVIMRAEGVMIHRGHHPDEVADTVRRQAAAAAISPHAFALDVLQELQRASRDTDDDVG